MEIGRRDHRQLQVVFNTSLALFGVLASVLLLVGLAIGSFTLTVLPGLVAIPGPLRSFVRPVTACLSAGFTALGAGIGAHLLAPGCRILACTGPVRLAISE